MNKRGHTIGGIATVVATTSVIVKYDLDINNIEMISMNASIMIGAFLPDFDAQYSYIQTKFKIIAKLYKMFHKIIEKVSRTKNNILTRHRGLLLHSIYTLIPFIVLYLETDIKLFLGLILGLISHHVLDMLGKEGLFYLYPFYLNRLHIWRK